MLPHPTHDRLIALGLVGMAKAFEEQRQQPAVAALTFEERLGLLVDREAAERQSKRLVTRLKFASLRQNATVEDAAYQALADAATGGEASWCRMSTSSACAGEPRSLKASIGFALVSRLSRVSRRIR
jgi:hypothetical protein